MRKFYQWLAYRVPNGLRYFVVIDAWAKATSGKHGASNASEVTIEEMLDRLEYKE